MSFNIGSQQAGIINNVAGDQTIDHGQQVVISTNEEALEIIRDLRVQLVSLAPDPDTLKQATAELDAMEHEVDEPHPDKKRLGSRLARLTKLLADVGSLTAATTTFGAGIAALAGWLGSFGGAAAKMLAQSR